MVDQERFAEIRRWLDKTDDGGSLEWHAAVAALGEIQVALISALETGAGDRRARAISEAAYVGGYGGNQSE